MNRWQRRAAAVFACLILGVVVTWPLAMHLGDQVPGARLEGDVALNLWALSWIYHQAVRDPLRLLDANTFHPTRGVLAFSDLLWGEALLGLPAQLVAGPVAAYGFVFLGSAALSALAMLYAGRRFGAGWVGSGFAAISFVSLPYLVGHTGHLQLQFIGAFPLLAIKLWDWAEAPTVRRAAWVGLALAIGASFSAYYALFLYIELALLGVVFVFARPPTRTRRAVATAAFGALVALALSAPALAPHVFAGRARSVHQAHKHATRASDLLTWTSEPTARQSEERRSAIPLATLLLAAVGLPPLWRRSRSLAVGLLVVSLVSILLAMGPDGPVGLLYAVLMRAPGFAGIRAPARLLVLAATCVSLLAAFGVDRLLVSSRRRAYLVIAAAVALIAVESGRPLEMVPVPVPDAVDQWLAGQPRSGAIIHLPAADRDEAASLFMLSSRAHFRPLVNGYSGERPDGHRTRLGVLATLPEVGALRLARDLGIDIVVRHHPPDNHAGRRLASPGAHHRLVFQAPGVEAYQLVDLDRLPEDGADADGAELPLLAERPFRADESLEYVARWSGMAAAQATLAVRAGADDRSLGLVCTARTTSLIRRLYDGAFELEAVVATTDLLPSHVRRSTREGARSRDDVATFDRARQVITVNGIDLPSSPYAHDSLTAFYVVRSLRLGPIGSSIVVPVNDLGGPVDLVVTVADRRDGIVELDVVARARGAERDEIPFTVRLEDSGDRRVLELSTVLKIGEVRLELVKTAQ